MDLRLPFELAADYKSASQRARVATEEWAASNLYCCGCVSDSLVRQTANTQVIDFRCPDCTERYQLKSQQRPLGSGIIGANYGRMMDAVVSGKMPNFHLLHYQLPSERVLNLLVIPRFAVSPSAIKQRKPLGLTARRAAWIGYVLDLRVVPSAAKISIVRDGSNLPSTEVRAQFAKIAQIESVPAAKRGWALDTLRCIEELPSPEFTTADAYRFVPTLSALHPENQHVEAKIRQQLQVLRDRGLLRQLSRGRWMRI